MALGDILGAVVDPVNYGLSKLTGGLVGGVGQLGQIPDIFGGITGQNQAEAALKAAQLQYQASQEAMKQQREMFDILNAQQAPYRQSGYTSLNALNALMGLPPSYATQGYGGPITQPTQAMYPTLAPGAGTQAFANRPEKPGLQPGQRPATLYTRGGRETAPMPTMQPPAVQTQGPAPAGAKTRGLGGVVGKIAGGGLGNALTGGLGLIPGGDKLSQAASGVTGKLLGGVGIGGLPTGGGLGVVDPIVGGLMGGKLSGLLGGGGGGGLFGGMAQAMSQAANEAANAPPVGAGPAGVPAAQPAAPQTVAPGYQAGEGMTGFGAFTRPFTAADLRTNLAPNYQFMLEQGLGATRQGANVGGGGSNIQRAATKFAEDYASNAYQNALQNYTTQQQQIYNRLSNLAGIGQTAQGQQLGLGSNLANALSQLGIGGASALGAGQVGAAGAQAGALHNLLGLGTLAFLT